MEDPKSKYNEYMMVFYQHQEENELECKSEVDRYLSDRCEATTEDFNILLWWKVNPPKYPILAEVARDILVVLISTVASKSSFNNERRILDFFRSSLSSFTVEAFICTQDWLKSYPNNNEELQKFMGRVRQKSAQPAKPPHPALCGLECYLVDSGCILYNPCRAG